MKKLLLILFICLGLQAQSQVVYCDSVSISISGSTPTTVTYALADQHQNMWLGTSIYWSITNFNTGLTGCTGNGTNPTFTLNNLDTVLVCAIYSPLTTNVPLWMCTICDTISFYNGAWTQISIAQPNGLEDVQTTDRQLLKVTNFLGRETKCTKNEPLFYIYDDGTVEKRILIE